MYFLPGFVKKKCGKAKKNSAARLSDRGMRGEKFKKISAARLRERGKSQKHFPLRGFVRGEELENKVLEKVLEKQNLV